MRDGAGGHTSKSAIAFHVSMSTRRLREEREAEEKRRRELAEAQALKLKIAATQMQTAARGRAAREELTRRVAVRHLPY